MVEYVVIIAAGGWLFGVIQTVRLGRERRRHEITKDEREYWRQMYAAAEYDYNREEVA